MVFLAYLDTAYVDLSIARLWLFAALCLFAVGTTPEAHSLPSYSAIIYLFSFTATRGIQLDFSDLIFGVFRIAYGLWINALVSMVRDDKVVTSKMISI